MRERLRSGDSQRDPDGADEGDGSPEQAAEEPHRLADPVHRVQQLVLAKAEQRSSISGSYATQGPRSGVARAAGVYLVPGGLRVEVPRELGGERVGAVLLLRRRLRARLLRRRPGLGHLSLSLWKQRRVERRRDPRGEAGRVRIAAAHVHRAVPNRGKAAKQGRGQGAVSWRRAAALPSLPFFFYSRAPRGFWYLRLCNYAPGGSEKGRTCY